MQDILRCPRCSTDNPLTNQFCKQCGASLADAPMAEPPREDPGFVQDGVWHRNPAEFVRRVRVGEMGSHLFGKGVEVPRGSVGVVVVDDEIREILSPGFQIAVGVMDRLVGLFTNKAARTDVYLIDLRPVPVPFMFEARAGSVVTKYELVVEARVLSRDKAGMLLFLEQAVGNRENLTSKAVYDLLRPMVQATVQPMLSRAAQEPVDIRTLEAVILATLENQVTRRVGMALTVHLAPSATVASFDLRLGGIPAPQTKPCVACGKALPSTKKFCTTCGSEQPVMTQPSRSCGTCGALVRLDKKFCTTCGAAFDMQTGGQAPLFTPDGHQVELDLVVRVEGMVDSELRDQIATVVESAVSGSLRNLPYSQLSTAEGFRSLEQRATDAVQSSLRTMGLSVLDITVLDLRSKSGEWLLGARAELDRALKEADLGREWMEVELKNLDLKATTLDLVLRSQRIERDHLFAEDRTVLDDRQRRQELLDRERELDVADASRTAQTEVALDGARRHRERAVATEDHVDRLASSAREQEAVVQVSEFNRENEAGALRHEQAIGRERAQGHRVEERVQARHELDLEHEVAQHDAAMAREAIALESDRKRKEADDRSYSGRSDVEVEAFRVRTTGEAELFVVQGKQNLELTAEEKRQALQVQKLRAMAELDAKIREDELREQRQKQDSDLKMREVMKGLSPEQMLAMQASGQGGEAMSQALAEKFKAETAASASTSEKVQELYERMLVEQKTAAQVALQSQAHAMDLLGGVTTAAVGGQRAAEAARQIAQQESSGQVVAMAGQTMDRMANVMSAGGGGSRAARVQTAAAAASRPERPKSAPRICPSCDHTVEPDDRVCGECGAKL